MPACFQMYATTKSEAENSDIDWGKKKRRSLLQLCNTESFGQVSKLVFYAQSTGTVISGRIFGQTARK